MPPSHGRTPHGRTRHTRGHLSRSHLSRIVPGRTSRDRLFRLSTLPDLTPHSRTGPGRDGIAPHGTGPDGIAPDLPELAGGEHGPDALRPLLGVVLDAMREGAVDRGGPLPAGGPVAVAALLREAAEPVLPDRGTGTETALRTLVHAVTRTAADPAEPHCAAHLHTPPLALAVAADLAAAALNPSMDSWDQAPGASVLESLVTRSLAEEVYPRADFGAKGSTDGTRQAPQPDAPDALDSVAPDAADIPDAIVTTGGTESNQLALLLARERHPGLQVICGAHTHHSIVRAAWLIGLPRPHILPAPTGTLDLTALEAALRRLPRPLLVTATAGTTDTGAIDPLNAIADLCHTYGADLHIDASYGGPLLFSPTRRSALRGLHRAQSVTLDLHKLGWQPVAAGLLTVPRSTDLAPLAHTADYLNADDDTEAGLPDLLGRSLRTTRRPDILKIAVTLKALGRSGLAELIDRTCAAAERLADLITRHPALELHRRPALTTVLFRPAGATDDTVATLRRTLLDDGAAVLGRARADGRLWLKATLLNPHITQDDLETLLTLVEGSTSR